MADNNDKVILKLKLNSATDDKKDKNKDNPIDKDETQTAGNPNPINKNFTAKEEPMTSGFPKVISTAKTQIVTPSKIFKKKTFFPKANANKFAPKEQRPQTPYTKKPNHFQKDGSKINTFNKTPPLFKHGTKPFFPTSTTTGNIPPYSPFSKKDTPPLKKKKTIKKDSFKPKDIKFSNIVGNNFIGRIEDVTLEDHEYYKIKKGRKNPQKTVNILKKTIELSEPITLKELANKLSTKLEDIISQAQYIGYEDSEDFVDVEILEIIATSLGHQVIRKDSASTLRMNAFDIKLDSQTAKLRPPIVTIIGHVDHGKTSLLDAIRKSNISKKEIGEITQRIGAYSVTTSTGVVTFIDTPGHAAFSSMREIGLQVSDIILLIISGTEGIKDQTIEAIKQIKKSKSEFLVVTTKHDLPNYNVDKIKQDLIQHEIIVKDYGGDTEVIELSAVTGYNIDLLLQTILTYSELLNIKANDNTNAIGNILESRIDNKAGVFTSLIIKQGTLKIGDICCTKTTFGKIKGMWNDQQKAIKKATPGMAVEVLGFSECPSPGDKFVVVNEHTQATTLMENKQEIDEQVSVNTLFHEEKPTLYLILNAETQGALEALEQNLRSLNTTYSTYKIIKKSIGKIKESDLDLAKISNAVIVSYGLNIDKNITQEANTNDIKIISHKIIYQLNEVLQEELDKLIVLIAEEVYLGKAVVQRLFKSSKIGNIAGCLVQDGKIVKGSFAKVFRKEKEIFIGKIESLKRMKDDVKEVKNNTECGIFVNYKDIAVDDEIQCYKIEYKKPDAV